jgi:transposase
MPYSTDLRQKIVRAYDDGIGSQRAIAELFGVSRSFVEKLLHRRRTTGEIAALPHGGGRKPLCQEKEQRSVRRLIEKQPDATLDELCEAVERKHQLQLSRPTMSRLLQRLDLGRKKSRSMLQNERPKESSKSVIDTDEQ